MIGTPQLQGNERGRRTRQSAAAVLLVFGLIAVVGFISSNGSSLRQSLTTSSDGARQDQIVHLGHSRAFGSPEAEVTAEDSAPALERYSASSAAFQDTGGVQDVVVPAADLGRVTLDENEAQYRPPRGAGLQRVVLADRAAARVASELWEENQQDASSTDRNSHNPDGAAGVPAASSSPEGVTLEDIKGLSGVGGAMPIGEEQGALVNGLESSGSSGIAVTDDFARTPTSVPLPTRTLPTSVVGEGSPDFLSGSVPGSISGSLPSPLADSRAGDPADSLSPRQNVRWFGIFDGAYPPTAPPPPSPPPPPFPPRPFDAHSEASFGEAMTLSQGWKMDNIKLDADCKSNWMLNSAASATALLVRDAINYVEMPIQFSDFLPAAPDGTELQLSTLNFGPSVFLSNMTIQRIDPTTITYGFCWDHLEWFESLPIWDQIKTDFADGRIKPDRLMIIASAIETEVSFDYAVTQHALFGNFPLGHGSGKLVVRGFIGLDADLHDIGEAGITDCAGHFGIESLDFSVIGVKDLSLNQQILGTIMPAVAAQMDSIICYGEGLASLSIYHKSAGEHRKFRGLVTEVNEILHANLGFVRFMQSGETEAERRIQALQDQARLASVGVVEPLGQGRFSMIQEGADYVGDQADGAAHYVGDGAAQGLSQLPDGGSVFNNQN